MGAFLPLSSLKIGPKEKWATLKLWLLFFKSGSEGCVEKVVFRKE